MKIVLTGVTGLVGKECLLQALKHSSITEVVALARREVSLPDDVDRSKLKTVLLQDFASEYPETVKQSLQGADGCIWNLALTPSKAKELPPEEVKKISHDYPLQGLKEMSAVANKAHPLHFVFTSGSMTERDPNKPLWIMPEYRRIRGAIETALLDAASDSGGRAVVQITKPGLIHHPDRAALSRTGMNLTAAVIGLPSLDVTELAAAELEAAMKGWERYKETLENDEIACLGKEVIRATGRYGR